MSSRTRRLVAPRGFVVLAAAATLLGATASAGAAPAAPQEARAAASVAERWSPADAPVMTPAKDRSNAATGPVGHSVTAVAPLNDDFANRQTITGASGSVFSTNVEATAETGEPRHADIAATASVWFRFTAPADGRLGLSTGGSAIDTTLAVYSGDSLTGVVEIASNDDADLAKGVLTSAVKAVPLRAERTVAIAVDGVEGVTGSITLTWSFAAEAVQPSGTFVAVTPQRILDTRSGQPVAPNLLVGFTTPVAIIPSLFLGFVDAVVLNVTAVDPKATGYATVFSDMFRSSGTSNLNFTPANKAIANTTVVPYGLVMPGPEPPRPAWLYVENRSAGSTHFVVDIVGWYGFEEFGYRYTPSVPVRIADTRTSGGSGSLRHGEERTLRVADGTVVPVSARAVVMNVTVTGTTANGFLTAWPSHEPRPATSNINWAAGTTVANLVYSRLSPGGSASFFNSTGNSHLVVDVVGWFAYDGQFVYHPLLPKRVVDTRSGLGGMGATKLGPATTRSADLTGGSTTVPEGAARSSSTRPSPRPRAAGSSPSGRPGSPARPPRT